MSLSNPDFNKSSKIFLDRENFIEDSNPSAIITPPILALDDGNDSEFYVENGTLKTKKRMRVGESSSDGLSDNQIDKIKKACGRAKARSKEEIERDYRKQICVEKEFNKMVAVVNEYGDFTDSNKIFGILNIFFNSDEMEDPELFFNYCLENLKNEVEKANVHEKMEELKNNYIEKYNIEGEISISTFNINFDDILNGRIKK